MSSRRSAPIVDLELHPSRGLSLFVTGVTVLATAAVYFSGVGGLVKAILISGILISGGFWIAARGVRVMPFSIVRAVFMQDEECVLVDRRGRARSCVIRDGMNLGSRVALMTLIDRGRRGPVLCLDAGSVDCMAFRRVRVRVRMLPVQSSGWLVGLRRKNGAGKIEP